jgi:hypothetical protein
VAAVDVNFEQKTATVTARPGRTVSRDTVEQALGAAGYGVTSLTELPAGPSRTTAPP